MKTFDKVYTLKPSPSIGPKLFLTGPKQFDSNVLDMVQKAKFSSGKSILAKS